MGWAITAAIFEADTCEICWAAAGLARGPAPPPTRRPNVRAVAVHAISECREAFTLTVSARSGGGMRPEAPNWAHQVTREPLANLLRPTAPAHMGDYPQLFWSSVRRRVRVGVDPTMTFSDAYRALRSAQKSNRGAPGYSRWVNRPAGRALAAGAYVRRMTPNQVTALSAVATYTAIAILAVAKPTWSLSLVVALLLLLGYALDSADGQLARLTNAGRPSGEWLDHVIDMGKLCLLHSAVAYSWVHWGATGIDMGDPRVLIPLAFLGISVVGFFGWLLSDLLIRIARAQGSPASAPVPQAAGEPASVLRSLLRLPSDYGLLALTFAWFATPVFFVTITMLMVANATILALALPVWFRYVRAIEGAR